MQELEKILEEINEEIKSSIAFSSVFTDGLCRARNIIINHLSRESTQEITRSSRDNDVWIPVDERLPEEPKENPVFDDKPLELYLVDMGGSYPLRAFWNGKQFTDGWSVLNVIAWRPLPDPYRPERSNDEKE